MRNFLLKIVICFVALIMYHVIFWAMTYFIPSYHYEKLIAQRDLTKEKVDNSLFLYYKIKAPLKTLPLKNILQVQIRKDEYFIRYLMLGFPSIDVIYDHDDKVIRIFDTYE